jgi:hypothetical protein
MEAVELTTTTQMRWSRRCQRAVRRLAWIALLLLVAGVAALRLGQEYVDQQIHDHLQGLLARHYSGLSIRIDSVRRLDGVGIQVRGLKILDPRGSEPSVPLLQIDEVLLQGDVSLERLWNRQLVVQHVSIRRPRIRAELRADGTCNLHRLWPLPEFPKTLYPPEMTVEDGVMVIRCASGSSDKSLALHELQLTARPRASQPQHPADSWEIRGSCVGEFFAKATFEGRLRPDEAAYVVGGQLHDVKVVPELTACLPQEIAVRLAPLASLRGRAHLDFSTAGGADRPRSYRIAGQFFDGWINDVSLPYSLTDLAAEFVIDSQTGFSISHATARTGIARLQLGLAPSDAGPAGPLTLRASTQQFPLDARLPQVLPPSMQQMWSRFAPTGMANVTLTLKLDDNGFQPEAHVECTDLSFTYDKFPYRVHGAAGTLHLQGGYLDVDLRALISGKVARMTGRLNITGEQPVGWIEIETDGAIPLDDELIAALSDKPQQFVRSLHPSGMIEFWGRFERTPQDPQLRKHLEIHLRNCSMRFDRFPYPVDKINGTVTVVDDRWYFERLTGRNDSGFLVARGSWDPQAEDQQHLKLDLTGTDIPLHEALRSAMREDLRHLWSKLQPRGTLDQLEVRVRLDHRQSQLDVEVWGQKWAPEQNIEGRTISVKPVWFPYRLDNLTGLFHYHNGVATLQNIQGEHGPARLRKLTAVCEHQVDGSWRLRVDQVDAEQLAFDEDLLSALPARLSQGLQKLRPQGPISLHGNMWFTGGPQPGVREAGWDVTTDLEDVELACGARLEHVRGNVRWNGGFQQGRFETLGELRLDSLLFRNMHITHIRGPLRLNEQEATFGTWSAAPESAAGIPRTIIARAFGGEVTLDGRISLSGDDGFAVQLHLTDGEIARLAAETGTSSARVTGKTYAALQLAGQLQRQETWRGDGTVRLFDADIYELPLMVQMLKLLNVRSPDSTAFTKGDSQFRVEGDRIYFQRMALQGDAISLIGKGDMNLQRQLNLDFYALVGREESQLPIFRPLFKEAARNVLLLEVTGTLNDPVVTPHPFPELNETLQYLFQEPARDGPLPIPNLLPNRSAAQPGRSPARAAPTR